MAQSEFIAVVRDTDGWSVPVTVTRKRVRNLNLRVHSDGSVTLSIPWRTSAETAQGFLNRKAIWIRKRVERRAAVSDDGPIPLDGPEAGTLPLWGELANAADALGLKKALSNSPTPLRPLGENRVPAVRETDSNLRRDSIDPSELQARIDAFYRAELARKLPDVVSQVERAMGVHASRWQIRHMKTRWGSCTPKTGAIRINSALAAYPPACLDYVVAHELTHLMEPSHNKRFHMLLDIYCPDNREIAKLLKRSAREVAREQRPHIPKWAMAL